MKCNDIKDLLFDYAIGIPEEHLKHAIDKHLKECCRCREELENIKAAAFLFDKYKIPEPSPNFEKKVLRQIEDHEAKKGAGFFSLLDKLLRPYFPKLPLEGLAVAFLIFLIIGLYRGFSVKTDFNIKDIEKEYQIIFNKAENPIIIKSEDKEKALDELKTIIHTHKGSVLQSLFIKEGISVTLSMGKKEVESFFGDLSRLGDVHREKEGYRDKEGKIMVLIIEH